MGVKDLWLILSPICEKKSIRELENKTVAIDLSVWICENQHVDWRNNNTYLRNLFFRTSYMLLLGVKPIFVLEGKAPKLKGNVLEQRREKLRHGVKKDERFNTGNRSRINSLQKQCEELLKCIGVNCLYSDGEAEALCALLNLHGIVDGVISKDSDCFLYGATTVYRNFNITLSGGTFEEYNMSSIERRLSLGRKKLIALSLLCGCDYNEKGIEGIGKETALKYLSTVSESEILTKLNLWRENPEQDESLISKFEKNLKQKALKNPEFPFYDVQNEFLFQNKNIPAVEYSWGKPNLQAFVMLMERKLGWDTTYAMEKLLPILSRWHLVHDVTGETLHLDYIIKKRVPRSVISYEVKWKDFDTTTVEPASLLKLKYGNAIRDFEATKPKRVKKARKGKKKSEDIKMDCELMDLSFDCYDRPVIPLNLPRTDEDSISPSDFDCTASDLPELSFIVESIVNR